MSHSDPRPSGEPTGRAAAVAAALAGLGVLPGERVLIMLPGGPEFVDAFTGAVRQGAVPLPVNPRLPAADVAVIATETAARLVLTSAERIHGLTDLQAHPPVPVDRAQGLWAAILRPR
ncbi:MAG: AMP-binding protein [Pseudonocardiaceae bacterium]